MGERNRKLAEGDRIEVTSITKVASLLLLALFCCATQASSLPTSAGSREKSAQAFSPTANSQNDNFFPVSVWYSGGKARAPMLEKITPDSPRLWKDDLLKIKTLGFNSVRTWVEWNMGEPREGEYD
ncbi:MAG TPA: beta-galactosidase, partial [Candidatus Sulfotelmatobacter sp.]|nr:beta-galactosidase [Candidatus Sulfotelmatobacter sp.]